MCVWGGGGQDGGGGAVLTNLFWSLYILQMFAYILHFSTAVFSHVAASRYAKWQHRLNKLWLTGVRRITQH